MSEQVTTPKILGYTSVSEDTATSVNENKQLEEIIVRRIEAFQKDPNTDKRQLALSATHIEDAFMHMNRALYKPTRVKLPGDIDTINE